MQNLITKILKSILLITSSLMFLSNCATSPTREFDAYEGYGQSFATALHWRFIKEFTGKDFINYLDGKYPKFGPGMPPITEDGIYKLEKPIFVTASDLPNPWVKNWGSGQIAYNVMTYGCNYYEGCVTIGVSPTLLQSPKYRQWIIETLEEPCKYIRNPAEYPKIPKYYFDIDSNRRHAIYYDFHGSHTMALIDLKSMWDHLGCQAVIHPGALNPHDGKLLYEHRAKNIEINETTGVIRFNFKP